MDYVEIAVLGDSIANGCFDETGKGWILRLLEKLNAQRPYSYYLNNYAFAGDRSADVFHKLCHSVIPMRPDVLIIAVGTNDISRWVKADNPTNMSFPLSLDYWERILDIARKNIKKIIVAGLIPCDESRYPKAGLGDRPSWRKNDDVQAYDSWLKAFSREHELLFLDFHDGFAAAGGAELLLDGTHPNTEGHRWMADYAYSCLKNSV
jgi:lysophospholipase L1-like esterase